jgi:VCBS repeat-containing protein
MIPGHSPKNNCQLWIFVWTIAIFLFGSWVHAAELKVNPSASFFVPVYLDTQEEIYSCDIRVQFDSAHLKPIGATLEGTILEGRGYQLVQNVGLTDEARFPVYSSGNLYTGSGIVLYIEFEPLDSPGEQSLLQLSRFRCNETNVQGGLWAKDSFSSDLNIIVNNLPDAFDQTLEIMEDQPIALTLTAYDADVTDTFSYTLHTNPTLGTVVFSDTNGHILYTPAQDIFGTEHFTYVVSDGVGLSSPGHITIIIRSGNDFPLGTPATVQVTEDIAVDFSIAAVDSDNDPITFELQTLPEKGTLSLLDVESGACRYTPDVNDFGIYFFTFTASDPYGKSEPAAMTLIISPVNDAPVASGSAYTLNEDQPLEIQLQGTDIDSGTLTYNIIESSQEVSIEILDAQRGQINIIPGKDHNGHFQFTFQVSDGLDMSEPAIVQLEVLPVNDAPAGQTGAIHLDEDTPKSFQVTGIDIENDPLSYAIHSEPDRGTLFLNEQSGECRYTPLADESGLVNFMFTASDGKATSEPTMFSLIINPVNDPPVTQNDSIEILEDQSVEITLRAIDIDSNIEAFSILDTPDGKLEIIDPTTGLSQYTPFTNFFGQDIFSFIASDAESTSQPGWITVTVLPINDPPVASSMSITANEDQIKTIQLSASDPDNDPITFTILVDPIHGTLFDFDYETMTVQYKPVTDYYGSDHFSYELNDGQEKSSIAEVDIDVLYVNDPPFVQSDMITVFEDESVDYTLKAFDEDSQISGFSISQLPEHGELILTNEQNGYVTYTPHEDYFGSDSFSYQCMDDESASEPALISIVVKPVNDLPVGYSKTFTLDEDIPITDTLSFDDPDYDMLTITVYNEPDHGRLTILDRRTGEFTYHPEENYAGDDFILFEACDDFACSGPVSMTFTMRPINDPPVAIPQSLILTEDHSIVITLTATDVEGQISTFHIPEYPQEGLLEIIDATAGLFRYVPEMDFYGTDFFLFQATDESLSSAPTMITISILPVNDAPESTASAYTLLEDNMLNATLETFDADGDDLTLSISPVPEYGWISSFDPVSGEFSYLPSSNFHGTDYFWYKVCDQHLCSVAAPITLTIQPVNDVPIVSAASYEMAEDTVLQLTLTGQDIDNDMLTFEITQPPEGTLVLLNEQSGICLYTPVSEANGEIQFAYRVFDGLEYSEEAEVIITIYAVNDIPIAFPGEIEILEDHSHSGKVMATDVDNTDLIYSINQSPMKGKLVLSETGSGQGNYVYTPYLNADGMDIFWFRVFDGKAYSEAQPFTINIIPVNDPPNADDFMTFINAGETQEWVLNASDAEADPITFIIAEEPTKGSVQLLDRNTGTIQYRANDDASGDDKIIFRVSDGKSESNDASVLISINPPNNHQPVANPMELKVTEGIASYFTLDAIDADNNPLTYQIFQEPTKGSLTVNAHTGETIYESYLNAQGMDRIVYFVNDGIVNSDPSVITLTIQPMPETVIAKQDILSIPVIINEEKTIESLNIHVLFDPEKMEVIDMTLEDTILNTSDYGFSTQIGTDGNAVFPISSQGSPITGKGIVAFLRFKILGNEGDIVVLEMPNLTCNENRIFGGFEIDGAVSSKIRLIINEIPIAYDGFMIIDEDESIEYPLVGYDLNSGDPISFTIVSYPEKGTLTLVDMQTGLCIFSTHPNEYGADSFVYKSFDGKDFSKPANISITINPINDRPVAYPLSLTVLEDIPKSVFLKGEDLFDPEDTLMFRLYQKPSNGGVAIIDPFNGMCIYQNKENYYGMDSFTYVVDDGIEKSEPVTVDIMVISVNDAPIPQSVTHTTKEDTLIEFDLEAVDPENDIFEFVLLQNPEMGNLEFNAINGHCVYQPNEAISGTDTFQFQVKDNKNAISRPTTIYIVITPENDPPVITSSSFEMFEDHVLSDVLTAEDQDQDILTFALQSQPSKGTLELNPTGEFIYTPFQDSNGFDSFIVAAKDPFTASENATITIHIISVNDPPILNPITYETNEDTLLSKSLTATDPDQDDITFVLKTEPEKGILVLDTSGEFTFNPSPNIFGTDTFVVAVEDSYTRSGDVTITIKINPVNDEPVIISTLFETNEDEPLSASVTATDADEDALTYILRPDTGNVTKGQIELFQDGSFLYTPLENDFGIDTFVIAAKDSLSTSEDTQISITIYPVNDPPIADAGTTYDVTETLSLELNAQGSTDIDGDTLTYLWTIPNIPDLEIQNETQPIATITAPYVEMSGEVITVTLTVTDENNASATDTAQIQINNMAIPEVSFTATPYTGTVPLNIEFVDTSTGSPEKWVWNFGDNSESYEQHPIHVYKKSGVYSVSLTVFGPGGSNTHTQTDLIQVIASTQPLEIDFSVDQPVGFVPHVVQFSPEITGEVTQWQWNFGDGSVSNDFDTSHIYSEIGTYTVSLSAQGQGDNQIKTYENMIQVKGHVLKGTVTRSGGSPLANYRVEAYLVDTFAGGTQTDETGQYTITGLLNSKRYVVGVWPPENETDYLFQYHDNVQSLFDATYIEINGEKTLDFMLSLAPTKWLTGQVTDGSNPIPFTQVDIYSDRLGVSKFASTDANGVYTITGLQESDDYRVSFYSKEFQSEFFYFNTQMSVKTMSQAQKVSPTEAGLRNIDIIVNPIQGGKIEGHITDIYGNPVSNMRVNAWSDILNVGGNAISDHDGHYVIAGLTFSDDPVYIVEIQSNGYIYQVYNKNNKTAVATGNTNVDFILQDNANISGTIHNTSGQAIPNAQIQIYSQANPTASLKETISSENGTYTFTGLQILDDYMLLVEAAGFPIHYFDNETDLTDANFLSVKTGSKTGIDFDLDKGMMIKGMVHDQSFGTPVAMGTKVTLRSDRLGLLKTTVTDQTGAFEFTGLDAEISDYILSVIIDTYLPAFYNDNQNSSDEDDTVYSNDEASPVQAFPENDAKTCHILLIQGASLTGLVSYNGTPISDATVEIQSDNGNWKTTTTDTSETNYTITGIMPGLYSIDVISNSYEQQSMQLYIDTESFQDFDLQDLPLRSIQGTVFNLEVDKQIQVIAQSQTKNVQKTITLVGTGQPIAYSIDGLLPASDYILELKSTDYTNQYYENVYQLSEASSINVMSADATDADFSIETSLSVISGTINFPDSATNGDNVRLDVKSSSTGVESFVEIEYSGNQNVDYSLTGLLPSDDYILQVRSDIYLNRYWNEINDSGIQYEENAEPVNTLSGYAEANFTLDAGSMIEGVVMNSTGETLEGIQIDVWSDQEKVAIITHSSSDGSYRVKGLEKADDYRIKATTSTNANFYYFNASESVQIPKNATPIAIESNKNLSNIHLIITKGETIAGKIRGVNGQAISGIWVNAWSETIGVGSGVFSNDDGSFTILDLPKSQDYEISAKPEWNLPYWSISQSNIPAPSSGVNLVLPDKTGFTVTGTIRDVTGGLVKDATVEIQSASNKDFFGWDRTDANGNFTIDLLPKATDYAFKVKPPENSDHAYYEESISITDNLEKNMILETGYIFSGTVVAKDTQNTLPDADISVWSETTRFIGEATTNNNGKFLIRNVPNESDYVVTVKTDNYLDLKREGQSPKTDLMLTVEKSGLIKGTVRSLLTGDVVPEASIEIYSQANQGLDVYNGVASTDENGHYSVEGLKPVDEQGNQIKDFVVTVYATGFPPIAKTGKQLGDTVSFDLTKGPNNEIAGSIDKAGSRAVAIDVYEVTQLTPERTDKFIKTVKANDDYSFTIDGLRSDGQFVFKFVTDDGYEQWAGIDDKGVEKTSEAKLYETQTDIGFQFSTFDKRKRNQTHNGPGPVQGLKSLSHSYTIKNIRFRTAVKSTGPDKPSSDANVTVAWNPPDEGTADLAGYYHFFDKKPEKKINKFTIDTKPPIRTRKITSRDLEGDDVNYYFHVASVDKEGRVGDTTSIAFRIDTTPPTNVNVTAPTLTDRQNIDLKLGATGASEMYISNLGYAEGGQWESRSVDRVWRLTDGDGSKNIYTRFRDKAGNEAKAAAITVYQPPLPVYTIRVEAWLNGDISPAGDVFVTQGEDVSFTITPDTDYVIDQLLLDDIAQSFEGNTYILTNVQEPHQIVATFKKDNEAPVAYDAIIDVLEDTPKEFTLLAFDPDGDELTYDAQDPEKGNLQHLTGNRFSYAPDNNDYGTVTFQFTVSDGELTSNSGTVTLNIIAQNDPPEIIPVSAYPDLNSAIAITLTANDVDSDSFTYQIMSAPQKGQVTINGNIVTYTPNNNYQGKDSFTYQANDGLDSSKNAVVTLWVGVSEADLIVDEDTVTLITSISHEAEVIKNPEKGTVYHIYEERIVYIPNENAYGEDSFTYRLAPDPQTYTFTIFIKEINDSPWFTSSNKWTVLEDNILPINLTARDIENNTLTYGIQQRPEKGQLTANASLLVYTPVTNFNGTVTLTVWVDDTYTKAYQEISIEVEPVNDPPVALNYYDHSGLSSSISFTLTANDIDGDILTYRILPDSYSGILTGSDYQWTFTPNLKKPKHEEIRFIANDGLSDSNVGTIYLYFGMDVVHAYGDEDHPINIREGLQKFHDVPDTEPVEITTPPESGQIQGDQYIPNTNFFGSDQFEFKALGKSGVYKIYMIAVDDPPVITGPTEIVTPEDHAKDIVFTVEDVDSKSLQYSLLSSVSHGDLSGTTTRYTYTPKTNYFGPDFMELQVTDGNSSVSASVAITILPVNDPPVGKNQNLVMNEDENLNIQLKGSDVEDQTLRDFSIKDWPEYGDLVQKSTMTEWTYIPKANYNGTDSFTFTLSDGELTSEEATVTMRIINVNDVPVAFARSITMTNSNSITDYLYADDHPLDHDTLIYALQSNAKKGMVIINNPVTGEFTYYPNNYETGEDYFTFKVNDGYIDSNTATVIVYISSPVTNLLRLKTNMQPPYNGQNYHYLIRDVQQGIVVREDDANAWTIDHQLPKGQYQIIIQCNGFELYASPDYIDLTTHTSENIQLIEGESPPDITMPDISHRQISGGFLLKMIPNQSEEMNPFELSIIIDNIGTARKINPITESSIITYRWLEDPDAEHGLYTDTLPDFPSQGDTMYTIHVQLSYDNEPIADYKLTYINYASTENENLNKPDDQKVFESTYGPTETVEYSNKLFYPLLGENFRVVVSDPQGQDIEIPVRIPSLPLSCLYIENTLNYDASSDYYNITQGSQTITPQMQLLAKIKHYTFGKDSLGSCVDISFVVAGTDIPVRYNPVYNQNVLRVDQVKNETAPAIEVPLLLNPESESYTEFKSDLLSSDIADVFFNEKGDGTKGFKQSASPYTIDRKNSDLIKLSTNHLTGIGFAVQKEEPQPPTECEDCDSNCFVGLLPGNSYVGFVWLFVLAGCLVKVTRRSLYDDLY